MIKMLRAFLTVVGVGVGFDRIRKVPGKIAPLSVTPPVLSKVKEILNVRDEKLGEKT